MWDCEKVNLFQNLHNEQARINFPLHKNKLFIYFILFFLFVAAQFLWDNWKKQCHLYRIGDKNQIQINAYLWPKKPLPLHWKIPFSGLVTETMYKFTLPFSSHIFHLFKINISDAIYVCYIMFSDFIIVDFHPEINIMM